MTGASLLVAALENEGVERIFGVAGEENLAFVESLRQSSIDLVVTPHEQSAAFMAATYARLTGKPGGARSTLGPGPLTLPTCPPPPCPGRGRAGRTWRRRSQPSSPGRAFDASTRRWARAPWRAPPIFISAPRR